MYGKLFASTFTGSMVGAGADVHAVWGYIIAHTFDAAVEINPVVAAIQIGMTPEDVEAAIEKLCAPDPHSRNPASEGRRLLKTGAFSYEVVSHRLYKDIRSESDRREYNRLKKQESRARKKGQPESNEKSEMSAEEEGEACAGVEEEADLPPQKTKRSRGSRLPDDFEPGDSVRKTAFKWQVTDSELEDMMEGFCHFWRGNGKTKVDWQATACSWVLRDARDRLNRKKLTAEQMKARRDHAARERKREETESDQETDDDPDRKPPGGNLFK